MSLAEALEEEVSAEAHESSAVLVLVGTGYAARALPRAPPPAACITHLREGQRCPSFLFPRRARAAPP